MSVAALVQRRRRRGVTSALPAGNATLVADLGGDSVVLAFYDARNNVTSSGGVVDAWDDTRGGAGYGPQLTSSGTARPAYASSVITGDGVDDVLKSSASATFAINGACSLIVIGAFEEGDLTTNENLVCIADASFVRLMEIYQDATNEAVRAAWGPDSGYTLDHMFKTDAGSADLVGSANRRLFLMSKSATTALSTRVANSAANGATASGNQASGNNILSVLARVNDTRFSVAGIRAVLFLSRAFTGGDYTTLRAYASAQHSTVETA